MPLGVHLLCDGAGPGSTTTSASSTARELAVDEGKSRLSILATVSLVSVGVITVAAIRVGRVTVRLYLTSGRARKSCRTGSKLLVRQPTPNYI